MKFSVKMVCFLSTILTVSLTYCVFRKYWRSQSPFEAPSSLHFDECASANFESNLRSIFSNDLGYALVGTKPVSIDGLSESLCNDTKSKEAIFLFLEKTFSCSKRFIVRIFRNSDRIEIVNVKALLKQIFKHDKLKRFIFKKYKSVEMFLDVLKNSDKNIFSALNFDPILVGIALGYGEENALFFLRRADIGEYLQKHPIVSVFPFDQPPGPCNAIPHSYMCFKRPDKVHKPKPFSRFSSLEQEWQGIKELERNLTETDPSPPYYIALLSYVSRYGSESDMVHVGFLKGRDTLAKLFYSKKPSEVIAQAASKR